MFNKHTNYVYRTIVVLLCLLALGEFTPKAHAQLGLGLAPMRVELRMAPGQETPIP